LIGITPRGQISLISTEESVFLNNLLPGDLVLADGGFEIEESVGMMFAEVKISAFTRGKCQMHAKDVEQKRKLAHLRIHVSLGTWGQSTRL
jgi:hypothetical protein